MAERYKVSVRVASQKGECAMGQKVGDSWVIDGKTPEGLCISALHSFWPQVRVLMFGGTHPWQVDPDITTVACPDAANPVVFELRRLRE
jgi:uncharacterized repeat protein (TIGR04076 family)